MNAAAVDPFLAKLAESWPPADWREVTVLVAASGGADSTALARGLCQLRVAGAGQIVLAHFNHRQRGEESAADEQFVAELAAELGLRCLVQRAPSPDRGSEESLRNLRYDFLGRAADSAGARYVATAHTADDQVETVLFQFLRGCGIAGLAGIPRTRRLTPAATLLRPLLGVDRSEVLAYLARLGKPFREDSSNQSRAYSRNRIRHELLPLLEANYNSQVRGALLRLAEIARSAEEFAGRIARDQLSHICRRTRSGVEIEAAALGGDEFAARAILHEIWKQSGWPLADMSLERWSELLAMAQEPAPPQGPKAAPRMLPGGVRVEREGTILRLTCTNPPICGLE